MKFRTVFPAILLLALPALLPAQDKPEKSDKPAKPAAPDQGEMMKRWAEAATPGPAHKVLEAMVGDWDISMKAWMAGTNSPPVESKGTTVNKWILGGRYVQSDMTGEMMGMPMAGLGLTGYDNLKKKYTSFWLDNLSTSTFASEGTADASGKAITFHGKMDEPMTGEKDKPVKSVHRMESRDRQVFEMYDLTLGPNVKVFEITYSRKK